VEAGDVLANEGIAADERALCPGLTFSIRACWRGSIALLLSFVRQQYELNGD
jgi:hypothetical protein